jgi:riboflavin synthase
MTDRRLKLTRARAVIILMREACTKKQTLTGVKRVLRACKALGIEGQDLIAVLGWLQICDSQGNPWHSQIERMW